MTRTDSAISAIPGMPKDWTREWSEQLRVNFPDNLVVFKPKLWCERCNEAKGICAEHKYVRCEGCKQRISEAHVHLSFVGEADVTERLNQVDPWWSWRPAHHDVDKDVLMAAVATGNEEIVRMVIDNAPPKKDDYGGMWVDLVIHDDYGREIVTRGYGDAERKTGPSAVKEVIGNGIRNAAMRRGVAIELWSRAEREEDQAERKENEAPDDKAAKPQTTRSQARRAEQSQQRPADRAPAAQLPVQLQDPVPGALTEAPAAAANGRRKADPSPQDYADLVLTIVRRRGTVDDLRAGVQRPATSARMLQSEVSDPWTGERSTVTKVLNEGRKRIEAAAEPSRS